MMNLNKLCLIFLFIFSNGAIACTSAYASLDFSTAITRNFSGGQHAVPLGTLGGMSNVNSIPTVFSSCNSTPPTVTAYYAQYTGLLGNPVTHYSGPDFTVYQLPGVPGVGVSFDMADPNKPWNQLRSTKSLLIQDNYGWIGFRSRVQYHIIGELKNGNYNVTRRHVGNMWAEGAKTSPTVQLWSPATTVTVNVASCKLDVPPLVNLNADISKPTQFNVTVEGCSGRTTVSTSFSDANSPATTSASLKNNGTATGYALKLEVVNGAAVQILPVASSGASSRPGEIPMGIGDKNVDLVKSFNAIVTEDGGKPQPGTLDFKAIVGVAYR
jgi:hypothetical protein